MTAYYNEIDPYAAQWLENLIADGHIASGVVDKRSIRDVRASDIAGFTQIHFFAGIGVWSYALRLAGWPDDWPVWTGSCPCQPFSGAGQRKGIADERHLWPVWYDLIRECGPGTVLGEQVAGGDGLLWLDHVQADMEAACYAFAAVDLGVAGVGGPHWRQRLWWVAHAHGGAGGQRREIDGRGYQGSHALSRPGPGSHGCSSGLAHAGRAGLPSRECRELPGPYGNDQGRAASECRGASGDMGNAQDHDGRLPDGRSRASMPDALRSSQARRPGPVNGFWADADWLLCTDGKWRPVEPGTQPLAHGIANRVGQLRAYGNAISPWPAKMFIEAVM